MLGLVDVTNFCQSQLTHEVHVEKPLTHQNGTLLLTSPNEHLNKELFLKKSQVSTYAVPAYISYIIVNNTKRSVRPVTYRKFPTTITDHSEVASV